MLKFKKINSTKIHEVNKNDDIIIFLRTGTHAVLFG